jgi:hypothetical protein
MTHRYNRLTGKWERVVVLLLVEKQMFHKRIKVGRGKINSRKK